MSCSRVERTRATRIPTRPSPPPAITGFKTGPHVMVVGADASFYDNYPKGEDPDTSNPYVMWAGTPYQHLMAPVKQEGEPREQGRFQWRQGPESLQTTTCRARIKATSCPTYSRTAHPSNAYDGSHEASRPVTWTAAIRSRRARSRQKDRAPFEAEWDCRQRSSNDRSEPF
jgi:hypothetical protein